jgi:23S rRNA pseudouridine1911/1915/1917 synthase
MRLQVEKLTEKGITVVWPGPYNDGVTYTDRICGIESRTLLEYYLHRHGTLANDIDWQRRIQDGCIDINGNKTTDIHAKIPRNALLSYHRSPWREPVDTPSSIDIIWTDGDLICINKPSCLQVLPKGPYAQRTVLNLLHTWFNTYKDQFPPGCPYPSPLHRLGRGTSGLLLAACSKTMKHKMSEMFANHDTVGLIRKVYRALVTGVPHIKQGYIETPIGRLSGGDHDVFGGLFGVDIMGGKPAKSYYSVLSTTNSDCDGDGTSSQSSSSIVEVEIFTGRPHQIRIHMASIGHPLVGDPLYGRGGCIINKGVQPGECGYTLHAMMVEFRHPSTREMVRLTSQPPENLVVI